MAESLNKCFVIPPITAHESLLVILECECNIVQELFPLRQITARDALT